MEERAEKRQHIIYDMRAMYDTDEASILSVEDSLEEAIQYTKVAFGEGVIYSYALEGEELVDEQFEKVIVSKLSPTTSNGKEK
mgnify:CR=1 FL=1